MMSDNPKFFLCFSPSLASLFPDCRICQYLALYHLISLTLSRLSISASPFCLLHTSLASYLSFIPFPLVMGFYFRWSNEVEVCLTRSGFGIRVGDGSIGDGVWFSHICRSPSLSHPISLTLFRLSISAFSFRLLHISLALYLSFITFALVMGFCFRWSSGVKVWLIRSGFGARMGDDSIGGGCSGFGHD